MSSMDKEWNNYKDWLIGRIRPTDRNYQGLLDFLHEAPFLARIDRDVDRIEDGVILRDEFCSENRLPIYLFDRKYATVLEVLVALAIRIDNEWIGDPGEEHPEDIFWEMLDNLGLKKFTDWRFNEDAVLKILERWIERKFDFDGYGSIFPLKDADRDQRKCEIWSQMQAYLSENYS